MADTKVKETEKQEGKTAEELAIEQEKAKLEALKNQTSEEKKKQEDAKKARKEKLDQLAKDILDGKPVTAISREPEQKKDEPPAPTGLTPQQLEIINLYNNPEAKPLFNLVLGGKEALEKLINEFLPKGDDYSDISPKQYTSIVEKALKAKKWDADEIEDGVKEFEELKPAAKRKQIEEYIEFLSKNKPALPKNLTEILEATGKGREEIARQYTDAKNEALTVVENTVTPLIGKSFHGIPITENNSSEIKEYIAQCSMYQVQTSKGMRYNTEFGKEAGLKAWAFDKVVKELTALIEDQQELIKDRIRPDGNTRTSSGASNASTGADVKRIPVGGTK